MPPLRALLLLSLWWLPACGGGQLNVCDPFVCTHTQDCDGEQARCSFDGVEAPGGDCDVCRIHLYAELCEAGSKAKTEEVDAGMVCEEVDTGE